MCKGYAILINDKEIVCGETNSHSGLKQSTDGYLKVNVIYDDETKEGYRIEPDCDGSSDLKNQWIEKTWLNAKGEICAKFEKRINAELSKPETRAKMFRVMCCNMQNATIEGYQYNDSATIKGTQYNYSATIKGNQSNNSATIKGNQYNDSATIKGTQYNYSATIKGNQYNTSATIEGNQYNTSATIEGYQYNHSATIKGDQYNDSATIKGDIIIYGMKNGSKETQKLLDEFTKLYENEWRKCTFDNFVKWLVKTGAKQQSPKGKVKP